MIFLLYVDDLFFTREKNIIDQCKRDLTFEFEMKDLCLMHYYLGFEVWKKSREIFLGQGRYIITILWKFGMMDCKSMATPMVTNLNKLRDFDSDFTDPSMCH